MDAELQVVVAILPTTPVDELSEAKTDECCGGSSQGCCHGGQGWYSGDQGCDGGVVTKVGQKLHVVL